MHIKKLQRIAKKYEATVVVEGYPEEYLVYTDSSTHRYDGSHAILGLGDTKGEAYADAAWRLENSQPCEGCDDSICASKPTLTERFNTALNSAEFQKVLREVM